jgi:chemotaxis protein histidine kinase CheA
MQSTPNPKETDPHDVFVIETLLHAHAEKAPPLAHDPAAPSAAPQVHVAPPISVGAPTPQLEPTFRDPDVRDIPVENVGPSEIKVDGLKPLGEPAAAKWAKRVIMALLGLCGAVTAAAWHHYGDQAKAVAAEWAPPFVLAALPSATGPAVAEQASAPATEAATTDQTAAQPAAAAAPAQPNPTATTATAAAAPSAESSQMQSMAQDLATMGQQVEELKATIAQLKASQTQMAREYAKASEAKAGETRPAEQNLRPRVSALTPPTPQRPAAPPPVRKPKPAAYSYSPAPAAAAPVTATPAAPLPPPQAAAPLSPAPPRQTIADDGEPVVRPPMPLR